MRYYAAAIEVSVTSILVVDSVWVCWICKELHNTVNENLLCVFSGKSGVGVGTCAPLSETGCEKYLPSRVDLLTLGGKSDSVLYYCTQQQNICLFVKKVDKRVFFFNLLQLTWIAISLNVIKVESIPAFHFGDQLSCLGNFIELLSLSRANTRLVSQLCHDHFFPHLSNSLFTNYPFIWHCIVWTVCSTAK